MSHDPTIDGYPLQLSYAPGETAIFCCSTTAETFTVEIARVGGRREIVWYAADVPGVAQPTPEHAAESGCGWDESFRVAIPAHWRSGYYEAVLRALDPMTGRLTESRAFIAVRPVAGQQPEPGRVLLVLATNTYNAYNDWGGASLYRGAVRASFQRPFARGFLHKPQPHRRYPNLDDVVDLEHERFRTWADVHGLSRWSGSTGWHNWERLFVQWAERAGYQVDVAINSDMESHPEILNGYRLVTCVGHDEYWSWGMRDSVEAYVNRGGNVAFFSGNSVCWQVRYEDDGQTMVAYKGSYERDPVFGTDNQHLLTTLWSSQLVGRPENTLTGLSFSRGGYIRMGAAVPRASGGYTVWRPDHWLFDGTDLRYGDLFGTKHMVAVYEVDGCEFTLSPTDGLPQPTGSDGTPTDFVILATAPARLWTSDELPSRYRVDVGDLEATAAQVFGSSGPDEVARLAHNHAVMGLFTNGGTVFNSGVTDWAYGLSGHDPAIETITRNVFRQLAN
jgi:hypothetical protein